MVANDFAAIAKRLKEIQQEVAAENAARPTLQPDAEHQPESLLGQAGRRFMNAARRQVATISLR